MASRKAQKTPKTASNLVQNAQPAKQAKSRLPAQIANKPLCWRFSSADKNGDWAWSNLSDPQAYMEVQQRLHEFESMHWVAIMGTGSHPIETQKLIKPAQDRLQELELDDVEGLMSFRITGAGRVFCIQDENIMHVLWYDPLHQICPAPKKHT